MTHKYIAPIYNVPFDHVVAEVIADLMPAVVNSLTSADPSRDPTIEEIIGAIHHDHPHHWDSLREEIVDAFVAHRIAHWLSSFGFSNAELASRPLEGEPKGL